MALPSFNPDPAPGSPPLSMLDIQGEFGGSAPISLSEYYSAASGIPASGTISIRNFYGTSARKTIDLYISDPTINYSVYGAAVSAGYVAGISDVTVHVNPGVYVGSGSPYLYGMEVNSFSPGDKVTVINSGYIVGRGGDGGGDVFGSNPGNPGTPGGNAVYLSSPTTIYNYGTIGGGGGGGGGSTGAQTNKSGTFWGGGGGGGAGYSQGSGGYDSGSGAPGSPGTTLTGGAGGHGYDPYSLTGGAGGDLGVPGAAGGNNYGKYPSTGGAGGSAGYYIVDVSNLVTWGYTGDRRGLSG